MSLRRHVRHDDMTKREIANLCCRVLAIYALMQAVPIVPLFLQMFAASAYAGQLLMPYGVQTLLWMVQPLLMGFVAIVLWRKSGVIAAWMVGHDLQDHQHEPDARPGAVTACDLHVVAFSSIGLLVLASAIPEIAAVAADLARARWIAPNPNVSKDFISGAASRGFMEGIVRVIIGLWLLFGASGLVRLLRRARDFGLEDRERPDYPERQNSGEDH